MSQTASGQGTINLLMSGSVVPSIWMMFYSVVYALYFICFAVREFSRMDIWGKYEIINIEDIYFLYYGGKVMKTLIIYESLHHGNTEKIAKAMAEQLNADMKRVEDANIEGLNKYDLIGFGSGIYFGKAHENIQKMVGELNDLPDKKAFVFSTSGMGNKSYNNGIINKLREKGFNVVGSFASKGYDTNGPFKLVGGIAKGRPDGNDLKNAKIFAEELIKK